jgi:ferric-dicitrate binding protein FerR (iron transport regulator)
MHVFRGVLALFLCVPFCAYNLPLYTGGKPLGILTMAYGAHLNASAAFAGVSVFDGESVSTEPEGKLSMRIGGSVITLAEQSAATLQRSGDGAHVDLDAGAVYLWSAESNPLEVHVEGALVRPHGVRQVQVQILMFAPKILQITTRHGSVDFSYGKEFRVLPEGQTYKIYLETKEDPRGTPGARQTIRKRPVSPRRPRWPILLLPGRARGLRRGGFTI